jgi:hypothetical protein
MKKSVLSLALLSVSLSLLGCSSGPSKEDVCGGCPDLVKTLCEEGYDVCADNSECDLSEYQDAMDTGGLCN